MKSFSVALCVLISLQVVYSHSASEEVKDVKECADEHHIKVDDIKTFLDGKEVSNDSKCFMKCVLMRLEVLKEDGTFDLESVKEHSHEELLPVGEECVKATVKNDDLCEMAYQHSMCLREKTPDSAKWKTELLEHLKA